MEKCGRIFMLNDDPIMLNMYAEFLRGHGLDVFATDNAYKMILYAREIRPNLIILDVNIPIMTGWQVLEYLKSDVKLRSIPVVMLTMPNEVQKAIALGAANFLLKPVEPLKLLSMVNDYCEYQINRDAWMFDKIKLNNEDDIFIK